MALYVLLPILGYAFFIHIKFARNISSSIFFSITFIISSLSLLGMLNMLQSGALMLLYVGVILIPYIIYRYTKEILQTVTSVPLVLFIVFAILTYILFKDGHYIFWDSLGYWGIAIKDMLIFHDVFVFENYDMMAQLSHPPGQSVWHYFINFQSGYNEGATLFGQALLLIGSTMVLYENTNFKNFKWVFLIFLVQVFVFSNFSKGFTSIYADPVISSLFVGIILSALSQDYNHKNIYLFVLPIISLILIKKTGMSFALISIIFLFLLYIVRNPTKLVLKSLYTKYKKILLSTILLIIISFTTISFWKFSLNHNIKINLIAANTIEKFVNDTNNISVDTQNIIKKRFWDVFFNQQIGHSSISKYASEFNYSDMPNYQNTFKLSSLGFLIIFILISTIAYLINKKYIIKKVIIFTSIFIFSLTIGYLAIMYLTYLTSFQKDHALKIPAYIRYANMVFLPLILLGLSFFMPFFTKIKEHKKSFIALLALLGLGFTFESPPTNTIYKPNYDKFRMFTPITDEILKVVPQESNVLLVLPKNGGSGVNLRLRFMLYPLNCSFTYSDKIPTKNSKNINFSKYDYIVWTPIINKEVYNTYDTYNQIPNDKEKLSIIKVIKSGSNINLVTLK